jgi:hypothetical protein
MPLNYVRAMNGDLLVPDVDAGRYCLRCGVAIFVTDAAHLCKDILIRMKEESQRLWQEWAREMYEYGGEGA